MKKICNVKFKGLYSYLLLFLLSLTTLTVVAQTKTITGTISDSEGLALPGVNVVVKGTTMGTVTDFDGKYNLVIRGVDKPTLVFSFIGFESKEVIVGTQTKINVSLKTDAEVIEDVVVVGFGRQKKETVVGSITQAKGEELLKAGSVTTVSEALTGLLPGVSTMQAAGQPGATQATILIRGQSSWNNNTPLFIVDGVEREFNDLDPNEIESISVLKDASATAVFGVKAANGVVLITTKRGQAGAPKITFSGTMGVKVPTINKDYVRPYHEALQYYNMAAINAGEYNNIKPQSEIDTWADPNRDLDFYSYTNWVDELVTSGKTSAYNLNITGGNKFVTYFTSFGYNYDGDMFDIHDQGAFDPRTFQKRLNWRSNLDFKFTKSTKVKIGLSGNFKSLHGNRVSDDSANGVADAGDSYLARLYSWNQVGAPPVLSDGRLGVDPSIATGWISYNYRAVLEREGEVRRKTTTFNTDFVLEQYLFQDLLFKGKLSHNFDRAYGGNISASPLYFQPDYSDMTIRVFGDDPDAVEGLITQQGESMKKYSSNLYYELSLGYDKKIGNSNVGALALFSRRKDRSNAAFPAFEESWVGRLTYGYKDKYLAEFNGAYNGSEKFAPGKRFGFFPSLAVGWVLSEENLIKSLNLFDFFKVRYSWGEIGSDRGAARFTYISTYGQNGDDRLGGYGTNYKTVGNSSGTIFMEGSPANENATWETAVKQNLGIELGFFESKLKANIDFFNEHRTGILMTRQSIPDTYGNSKPDANIGETKNHGIDLELILRGKIATNWTYRASGNLSLSENRIVNKDDLKFTPEFQKDAGKPIGWASGYINNGIMQSWDDVYNYTQADAVNVMPGDFIFTDYNGDGLINKTYDMVPIGEPSYASKTYAFSLNIGYKNFSINAMFNGMFGLSKALSDSYLWEFATNGGYGFRMLNTEMLDFWTPENPDATHPALHLKNNKYNTVNSSYSYRPSDFLRFKTLELKYSFSKKTLKWQSLLSKLEIYVNGNNLHTWQKLPSQFDPEARKLEVYPIAKRYNIGIRATL